MENVYKGLFAKTLLVTLVATFVVSPARAIPPDPDNAALLYYQAFLTLAQLSDEARDRLGKVALGETAPDDQVREDISKCAGAIEFAEAAVKVPTCHWGVRYSQGFDALMPQLAQMRFLTFVLLADARVRSADGDYKGALERCLMTGTFARHIGDDTVISYLVSIGVHDVEYRCMQDVVARATGDAELLQWLKNELATSGGVMVSIVRPLKIEIEIVNDLMRMDNIKKLAHALSESDKKKEEEIVNKADEQTLARARRIYDEHMDSAMTILSTPMPYEQAYSQLKQLTEDFDHNDPASSAASAFVAPLYKMFAQRTTLETHANAIMAAIDILLSRAKTGRLPDTLPSGLPKDQFTGKDFEYSKTKDGFVLRCPGKEAKVYRYEFKIDK